MVISWLAAVWEMLLLSSLWLLVGFVAAALVKSFLPTKFIERHIHEKGFGAIIKASAVGVPLPLCSCSVIPVAVSLRRKGAGAGATASFLVSTPEIGVDSFLLSYGLLGPLLAWVRVAAAFVSAIVVGLFIDRWGEDNVESALTEDDNCCHPIAPCCGTEAAVPPSILERLKQGLHWSFRDLVDDIAPSLILGFVLAGLVTIAFPHELLQSGRVSQIALMCLMLVVSMPLYVCASSSTPLAASMLLQGVSPGAVLVFLLAGPATNVATMLVVKKEFGPRGLLLYIVGISGTALIFGLVTDQILGEAIATQVQELAQHHHGSDLVSVGAATILVLLLFSSLIRRFRPTA